MHVLVHIEKFGECAWKGLNTLIRYSCIAYLSPGDGKEPVTYDYIQDNLEVPNVVFNTAYGVILHSHGDDNVNTKQNEAYAMSITTRDNVNGLCNEYDYI